MEQRQAFDTAVDAVLEFSLKSEQQAAPEAIISGKDVSALLSTGFDNLTYRLKSRKNILQEVQDKYTAVVKMVDSGDKLKLDQNHVETVIPAPGKKVLILNGKYRDTEAILDGIDEKNFCATLTLDSGPQKGRSVNVAYEDFSKLA